MRFTGGENLKIGIVTFHRANNLGANLQAFALNKYICENIGDCEIIDYIPNNQVDNRSFIRKSLSKIKKIVLFFQYINDMKFEKFRKRYYKLSNESYYGDSDIFFKGVQYDVLISGSDQILNTTLSGDSKSFYLAFCEGKKKISYASSFGRENISNIEKNYIEEYLSKFNALSVREKSAADILKKQIDAESKLVLDPVFLMEKKDWRKYKAGINVPKKYIFVYAMEVSSQLEQIVEITRKKLDIAVLVVYGGKGNKIKAKEIKNCGPSEFISYIENAELIITNSFHGTAFSVIFEKNFICVSHSTRNTRLENILNLCNFSERMIAPNSIFDIENALINGGEALKKLSQYIQGSKEYLTTNCKV